MIERSKFLTLFDFEAFKGGGFLVGITGLHTISLNIFHVSCLHLASVYTRIDTRLRNILLLRAFINGVAGGRVYLGGVACDKKEE